MAERAVETLAETEEDPDLEIEKSLEEKVDAIYAVEKAISPETAEKREKTAEIVEEETKREEAEEIPSERKSDFRSVHLQVGTALAAPVKWRRIETTDLEELTTDLVLVEAVLVVVPELAREDLHPTAMTLVPVPLLIAEMIALKRKEETKAAEDQDLTA